MSVKVKQGLQKCFTQIKQNVFDEDTIRTLLILSREYLPENSLIREIAHFVAHPDRSRGIFHKKVNNRYTKWKLTQNQVDKYGHDIAFMQKIKTENELSDFLLGGVNIEKTEARLFEILYFDGLNDVSEQHLKKYTGLNRSEAANKLKKYFKKNNGFYVLNREAILSDFKQLLFKKYNFSGFDKETLSVVEEYLSTSQEVKDYIEDSVGRLDSLQKVIRGTIEFKSVFTPKEFLDEIIIATTTIIKKFNLDSSFVGDVKSNKNEIQLCVMTLLHDAKFIYYDNNCADIFLCFYLDGPLNYSKDEIDKRNNPMFGYDRGVLALYVTYDIESKKRTFPLFVSNLLVKEYLSFEEFSSFYKHEGDTLTHIPWIIATRRNGHLILSQE